MSKVINIVGYSSNVGKTLLIENLIKELKSRGYSIATIKHDVHGFDIDKKGKDTYKHREAGAETVVISSKNRFAMIKELNEEIEFNDIIKLLLDKDNRVTNIPVPTDEDYYIEHPTARSFDDCCNEFWNTVTYVVKGLCRKEILFAIDHLNNIVRMELLRMISWKVGIEQGYSFSLGKNYKFLERYISPELWKKILATYNMGSYTEMWKSLELCMGIFRMVSKEVAQCLNYLYPDYDKNISNYVIRQKEKYQR